MSANDPTQSTQRYVENMRGHELTVDQLARKMKLPSYKVKLGLGAMVSLGLAERIRQKGKVVKYTLKQGV